MPRSATLLAVLLAVRESVPRDAMDHIWDSEEAIFTAYELLARRGFITESGKALTPAGETAVTRLLGMMEGVL